LATGIILGGASRVLEARSLEVSYTCWSANGNTAVAYYHEQSL
jgi:hypothetical protein